LYNGFILKGSFMHKILIMTAVLFAFISCNTENQNGRGDSMESPENAVAYYCEEFFKSAPPNWNKEAAKNAYNMLSSRAQKNLPVQIDVLSGRLALFAGVQDIPDEGFEIVGLVDSGKNSAIVETKWNYSADLIRDTATIRVFYLVKEGGKWKIDAIR
jgi:hypothetical protein